MVGDGLGDVVQIQAQFLGLDNELFQLSSQQPSAFGGGGRGGRGHDGTDARQDFQHPLGHQLRDDFVSRVGIDPQLLTQRTDRREGVARPHLASDYGLLGGIDYLLID